MAYQRRPNMRERLEQRNPEGWDEVDGVKLPPVSPWAQLDQGDLDKVHRIWTKQGER